MFLADGGEPAGCGQHASADLGNLVLSQHTGGRLIIQVRVQSLEPSLCDFDGISLDQHPRCLNGHSETLLDLWILDAAFAVRSLSNRPGFLHTRQVGNQPGPEQVA